MSGYFCRRFITFMRKGKSLKDFTNWFSLTTLKRMMK